jgi:hypothetical protein
MTIADEAVPEASSDDWRAAARPLDRSAWIVFAVLVVGYAVLGLVVLDPEAVYSGDIGVKFVQARGLAAHRFTSLDIPYPGERLDPARTFFPIRPPFVFTAGGSTQAIFSPASAVLQAVAVGLGGLSGLIALSVVAGAVVLLAAARMAPPDNRIPILLALGVGGPLWFYAVSGWEHAPAVAFSTAGYAVAAITTTRRAPLVAGLLVGAGAVLRDEVLLLVPGVALVSWLRTRAPSVVIMTVAGALVPLVAAAVLEVGWFGRPPAAHLRHAVHLVQKIAHLTDDPNPELPVRDAFTLRDRYETVVQYWLLGYGRDRVILLFTCGLVIAVGVRWKYGSSIGLLLWLVGIVTLSAIDLHEVATAPKWLAGMLRVSPYLVFAFLPAPGRAGSSDPGRPGLNARPYMTTAILWSAVVYLIAAFAGVDTSGGKSLGPRLLLPLFPLLTVSAVARILDYRRAEGATDRWIGLTGVTLGAAAILIHVSGTIPAYLARNRDDAAAIATVAAASESVVLADDEFTAQLLLPLYYSKIVLLVDAPDLAGKMARRLADEHITRLMVVSRRPTVQMSLRPFDLERVEPAGRMSIQYWYR